MSSETASKDVIFSQWKGFLDTPPLWLQSEYFKFPQFQIQEISGPERVPIDFPISRRLILGKRAEIFFRYYLDEYSNEQILACNEQIFADKTTIGELDFLLKNRKTSQISHVELVYKFYLYDPTFSAEQDRWIGPNRKDSLVRKLNRLKDHQFPLLYRRETQNLLEELQVNPAEIEQKVCFKANLFVPYKLLHQDLPHINNNAICGFWIRFSEFTESNFGQQHFFSPKKYDWPVDPATENTWFTFEEMKEQLAEFVAKKKSPLVWMKKENGSFERFFIVWW